MVDRNRRLGEIANGLHEVDRDALTGIHEEQVRHRIIMQGAHEVDAPPGVPGMFFKKHVHDRWWTFSVPKAMGADGYRVHEIDAIEAALSWFEIELYPFDAILNG